MPIEVYTGKPRQGKTALAVERLISEATKENPRPLFQCGIDGLEPGIATEIADIRNWNNPASPDYVPDGALVFVDEAWKWFGHLHDASRQATPKHVLDLAEHGHRGIDFVWTTQGPGQLYPFARPLIADHFHVVRRFGTSMIDVFHWGELQDDVKSESKREAAIRTTRALPSKVFGRYKSATEHTVKARIPMRVYMLPVLLLALVGFSWMAYATLRPSSAAPGTTDESAAQAADQPLTADGTGKRREPMTLQQWAERMTPRHASLPWSAPMYDDRKPTADPRLFCVFTGAGLDGTGEQAEGGCRCYTEQATPYELPAPMCRKFAQQGEPYNPFREPPKEPRERRTDPAPEPLQALPAPATATDSKLGDVASYGGMGV